MINGERISQWLTEDKMGVNKSVWWVLNLINIPIKFENSFNSKVLGCRIISGYELLTVHYYICSLCSALHLI